MYRLMEAELTARIGPKWLIKELHPCYFDHSSAVQRPPSLAHPSPGPPGCLRLQRNLEPASLHSSLANSGPPATKLSANPAPDQGA
jgi:hypothetical protein